MPKGIYNILMLHLLMDENFDQRILHRLKLRIPSLDAMSVQDTPRRGLQDPPLLQEAAALQRVLVTRDLKTMPRYAYARVAAGEPMPGVMALPDALPIGQAIEQLHLVVECLGADNGADGLFYQRTPLCNAALPCIGRAQTRANRFRPGQLPRGTTEGQALSDYLHSVLQVPLLAVHLVEAAVGNDR